MKAHLRKIRLSVSKANIVAGLVRHKSVKEARDILSFTNKKAAYYLLKGLNSAVANAVQNNQKVAENLKIDQIIINKGSFLKRFLPSNRGRALPIHKPTCHITIILSEK